MKKIYIVFTFLILFICTKAYAFDFNVESKNIILYNMNDNNVIYEENSNEKVPIASLTKIMTAIVSIENIDNLKDYVTITNKDLEGLTGYAKAGFKIGDKVTYEDLLYALMLPSGADAAQALSNNIENFIDKMNDKAKELKLTNTEFSNPVGMDDEHNHSSAKDVAKLLIYALKNETFKKIFSANNYVTTNNIKLVKTTKKTAIANNIDISNVTGTKTGYTGDAGYCLASTATIKGIDYLMVTLASQKPIYHIIDTANIYKYYGDNYSYIKILRKGKKLKTLKIKFGKKKTYDIIADKDIEKYLKNDTDLNKIEYIYSGIDELNYKIKKGDYLGKVKIKYDGKTLNTYKVYLNEKIEYIIHWFIIVPVVIIILLVLIKKKRKRRKKRKRV